MTEKLPTPHEEIISMAPLTVRRTVRWSECDPAGIVYAGRFPDFMITAADHFRTWITKAPLGREPKRDQDTPGKGLNMVFISPLWPGDVFDMSIYLGGIGKSTVHLLIAATRADNGIPVFAGRLTSIRVNSANRAQAVSVSEDERVLLENYASKCGDIPDFLGQVAYSS